VDEAQRLLISIEDLPTHESHDYGQNKAGNSVPSKSSNYDNNFAIKGDRPITITSPEGPSYSVKGNQILWQKFDLRIGYDKCANISNSNFATSSFS
jgi:Cu2+-containing amine oxidase